MASLSSGSTYIDHREEGVEEMSVLLSVVPAVLRRRLIIISPSSAHNHELPQWRRCIVSSCLSNSNHYTHPTDSMSSRSFATSRQKRAMKQQTQNDGKAQEDKKSIHGLRPNQTPSAAAASSTSLSIDSTKHTSLSNSKGNNGKTALILPPSVSQMNQPQSSSARDNFDYAHAQPAPSIMQNDYTDDDNALRKLLLQQGILPSPPRPGPPPSSSSAALSNLNNNNLHQQQSIHIPEADPSGVSHADPEDILNMASMYDPSIHLPDKPNFNSPSNREKYEAGTPLTDELIAYIGVRGPITVAEFMRRVLRDGRYGYYTSKGSRSGMKDGVSVPNTSTTFDDVDDNDWDLDDDINDHVTNNSDPSKQHVGGEHVIGASGDFITAPEVSELFGASLLVWLMTQYQALGNPSKIQLIEIGPGKGTLICDIMRSALTTFPDFASALTTSNKNDTGDGVEKETTKKVAVGVHLVEVMDGMRARQKESLQKLEKEEVITEKGYSFRFADSGSSEDKNEDVQLSAVDHEADISNGKKKDEKNTISVNWHDVLSSVPTHDPETGEAIPTFIICQELVDALPIHSFQKIEADQWRERLVDVAIRDKEEEAKEATNIKLAAGRKNYSDAESTSADNTTESSSTPSKPKDSKLPRLRFVLPPDTTPALRTLLRVNGSGIPLDDNPTAKALNDLPTGSVVEACPEGLLLAQDIADRIQKCNGGAALLIDYGEDGASSRDTMRGFWRHTQVHPLSLPGEVDVTADVDFAALREAVNQRIELEDSLKSKRYANEGQVAPTSTVTEQEKPKDRPEAFGPVSQGQFLASMGIVQRVERQIEADSTTDEQAYDLYSALERLLAPDQMGQRYKVLAIARKKEGLFPPPGF